MSYSSFDVSEIVGFELQNGGSTDISTFADAFEHLYGPIRDYQQDLDFSVPSMGSQAISKEDYEPDDEGLYDEWERWALNQDIEAILELEGNNRTKRFEVNPRTGFDINAVHHPSILKLQPLRGEDIGEPTHIVREWRRYSREHVSRYDSPDLDRSSVDYNFYDAIVNSEIESEWPDEKVTLLPETDIRAAFMKPNGINDVFSEDELCRNPFTDDLALVQMEGDSFYAIREFHTRTFDTGLTREQKKNLGIMQGVQERFGLMCSMDLDDEIYLEQRRGCEGPAVVNGDPEVVFAPRRDKRDIYFRLVERPAFRGLLEENNVRNPDDVTEWADRARERYREGEDIFKFLPSIVDQGLFEGYWIENPAIS